ncbi:hypothetical protein FEP90_03687 [Burkholderia multivorans]|nr:hypothetical protein [Burkholderia multivorans]MDR8766209.1 hypothetical protein [Burkholderia multivorans]MDR8770004.1 hypothetical protein [Burkholderia multivorans]MDR8792041.1 hypothetical protein [Burkholderia multivorans]MDR8794558.1 hypothetical protein [Burkholderia multivorans]
MAQTRKLGKSAKTSDISKVVRDGGTSSTFEMTCVEGEHLLPST